MSVCNNQEEFEKAVYKASKYVKAQEQEENKQKMTNTMSSYLVVHTIFMIWGILLAFKSVPPEFRVLHITAAVIASPAYVLAYYLNMFVKK